VNEGSQANFRQRLRFGTPLVLDAAMGSDLDRRGLPTTLPLWSAVGLLERPELVCQIHLDNLLAGADIITTDTFRTTARTLRKAGIDPARAPELDMLAVRLAVAARAEAGRPEALIAGSIAPLEDCYLPTFETPPETEIALRAAVETGRPATVGFVCAMPDRDEPVRLLSGETLNDAVARVNRLAPEAIFVNCAAPPTISAALQELRELTTRPTGAYANVGHVDENTGWRPDERVTGERYAEHAAEWIALGARVVGGCCGTNPEHTAALRRSIDALPAE
jgi:S-methylmethionine-dependent homocysteine/selenocysteine methylase